MKPLSLKRILTAVLTLAMLLSLVACAAPAQNSAEPSKEAPAAAASAPSSDDSSTPDAEDGPLVPYVEPVTISWGVPAAAVQQFKDGDTFENNVWSRLIKEKLNIDVVVGFSADASTDAFNNKMNVLLASGDLPDVVKYSSRTFFEQAIDAGYLQPIGDVFDQYASENVKAYQTKYPGSFKGVMYNDEMYAFPAMNDNFHQAMFLWIRDDWLANTNTQPPKTVDEMIELARIYTEEDPDGNGVDDTYGFALSGGVYDGNYGTIQGLCCAFGVPGGNFYRKDDGSVTYGYIEPGMKEALAIVRDMYAKGYIDPEFMAENTSSMEEEWTNGVLGMTYHKNWGTWHPFNYSYQKSGVITRPYPIPTVEGIDPVLGIASDETGDRFMVSVNCKNPEAIIKILNLYEATCISTDDPNDFATYWADEQYRFCPIYVAIPTELFAPEIHAALKAGSSDGLVGTPLEYYNYVVGFEDGSLADNTNAYGTWGQMYIDGYGGSMKIALDYKANGQLLTDLMVNDIPEIWKQNSSVLGDMLVTAFVDIIVGNQPLDYFDTVVENWLAAGGQQTLDELDTLYPAE